MYNMKYKEISKQLREKGNHFFNIMKINGFKKETSPDWICCFIMSDIHGKFQIFQFNRYLVEVDKIKSDLPSKESALDWLSINRCNLKHCGNQWTTCIRNNEIK